MTGISIQDYFYRGSTAVKALMVLAVLGISVLAGQNAARLSLELIITISGVLTLLTVSFKRADIGVLILVLTALFVGLRIGAGSGNPIPYSLPLSMLVFGIWLASMVLNRKVRFVSSPVLLPLLGFVAACLVSLPWSWLFYRPDVFAPSPGTSTPFILIQLAALSLYILPCLLFIVGMNVLTDPRILKLIVLAVIGAGSYLILARLFQVPVVFGVFDISNEGLFTMWVGALAFGQALFNTNLRLWQRVGLAAVTVAWLYFTLELGVSWISGWAPLIAAISVICVARSWKLLLPLTIFAIGLLVVRWDFFYERVWLHSIDEDFNRFAIWRTVITIVLTEASVVFGAGPAGYYPFYRVLIPGFTWPSHSNYIDILAQTGVVGSLFFAWFAILMLWLGWKGTKSQSDPFLQGLTASVLGGFAGSLIGMVLGDWVLPFVYNIGFGGYDVNVIGWLLFGSLAGLAARAASGARLGQQSGVAQANTS